MDKKSELRRWAVEHRKTLTNRDWYAAVTANVPVLGLGRSSDIVAGYSAFRDEADPKPLMLALAQQGHPLALPAIEKKGRPLLFRRWQTGDELVLHQYGMAEPLPDAEIVVPAIILVPLLAFDAQGWRLGYGGGFYDRTLANLRAKKAALAIGIAYAGQQIDAVPHGEHDQRLDAVLTETGLRRFSV